MFGKKKEDYYSVLGVDEKADDKAIRKAYINLSLDHHPDKNPENVKEAKAKFVKIGKAYEVLSDPQQRAEYDRKRKLSFPLPKVYDKFRQVFEKVLKAISDDELKDIVGKVALVASLVGSVLGGRLLKDENGNVKLRGIGTLVKGALVKDVAIALVEVAHKQAQESRDGTKQDPKQAWKDLLKATTNAVKEKAIVSVAQNLAEQKATAQKA